MLDKYWPLETKYGRFWIVPTTGDHIYLSAGSNLNAEKEYPEGMRRGPIVINGVTYAASTHAYLWEDGQWRIGREDQVEEGLLFNTLYLSRYPGTLSWKKDLGSKSERTKLFAEIESKLNAWAGSPTGMAAIQSGQAEHLRDEIESIIGKIEKAQTTEKEARAKLFSLRQQLEKVQDRK